MKYIHITATGFEYHCEIWQRGLEERPDNFLLIQEPMTQANEAYLRPLLSFSSVKVFEIFC